ncbi:hypothetical protein GCM10010517_63440 [Streptosporangium fragile]|uniref:Uncharacterized protein n=1 Tax=Streptosporangium fragile TaxID=46186 RepID=A0ABP6IML6_9ACTN
MPRRRPSALRAHSWASPRSHRPLPEVPGISSRTRAAIARIEFEHQYLWPGAVAEALAEYRQFLRQPGRYLYVSNPDCPFCYPVEARDTLEHALRRLRHPARTELSRITAKLDEELQRRTLPDPRPRLPSGPFDGWWYHRLYEQ